MPIRIWNRTGGKGPVKRETASSQTEKAGQENHDRQKTENKPKSHKPTVRNILVLGKTGVGKTSLLNYQDSIALPTSAGLPQTATGLH